VALEISSELQSHADPAVLSLH